MSTGVILLAAGSGQRFGGRIPKQFLPLNGEPLFFKSLRVFASLASVLEIVVVASPNQVKVVEKKLSQIRTRCRITVAAGGKFRGESVRNGLRSFSTIPELILVHDTARALVDKALIKRVEAAVRSTGVALAAWPLPDTLKKSSGKGLVEKTIPRKDLWLAQTPQGFKRKIALECLMKPSPLATDDVELAQRKGHKVKIVLGSAANFKITYPFDYKVAKKLT